MVFAALAVLATTGCVRFDLEIIVQDPGEPPFTGRITVPSRLLEMMSGAEALKAIEESFCANIEEDGLLSSIVVGSDPGGSRGVAVEERGPHDAITGFALNDPSLDPNIEQTENVWRFSAQTGRLGYELMAG